MLGQYLPLAVLLILAAAFVAGSFATRQLLATNRMTEAKLAPYECGIVPTKDPPERFPVKFYLVAMSFIVFDIEIIFLYPWATIYRRLGPYGLFAVAIFSAPIIVSLAYEFSKGALDWGPVKSSERSSMVSSERTSTSTVRRVGLDGRPAAGEAEAPPSEAA